MRFEAKKARSEVNDKARRREEDVLNLQRLVPGFRERDGDGPFLGSGYLEDPYGEGWGLLVSDAPGGQYFCHLDDVVDGTVPAASYGGVTVDASGVLCPEQPAFSTLVELVETAAHWIAAAAVRQRAPRPRLVVEPSRSADRKGGVR